MDLVLDREPMINFSTKIIMFLVITLYIFRDVFMFNIPTLIFFALYFMGFLILDRKDLLVLYMFLIPLSNGPLLYFVNVIYSIFYLLKNANNIKINKALILSFLIVFWEAFHLLPNTLKGYNESIIKFLGFSLVITITSISITHPQNIRNFKSVLYSWIIGVTSLFSILLMKYTYYFGINNFSAVVRRFGWIPKELNSTSTTLLANPNGVGKLVILTFFSLLILLQYEKVSAIKIRILMFYLFLFLLMSASRGAVIVFTVLIIMYFISLLFTRSITMKKILWSLSGTGLLFFTVRRFMGQTIENIGKRFQNEDISGSRFEIYRNYLNSLKNNFSLLVGRGIQDPNLKYGLSESTHNMLIEIVAIWGLVGLILVFTWFTYLYIDTANKYKNKKIKNIVYYLPLFGLFLHSLTGQFFISYYNTLPTLILVFLNIHYANEEENSIPNEY